MINVDGRFPWESIALPAPILDALTAMARFLTAKTALRSPNVLPVGPPSLTRATRSPLDEAVGLFKRRLVKPD